MPASDFDIYATTEGYAAVTNQTRRRILDALAEGDQQLPDLVELTGKAKPTLSGVHMRELLDEGLIEEAPHPDDARRKVYRLAGRKIGSSNVPVDQLRDAVKEYVTVAPLAARFPLSVTFDALAAAPQDSPQDAIRSQATRLGRTLAPVVDGGDVASILVSAARLLEREGLARAKTLDLEASAIDLLPGDSAPRGVDRERLAVLLAGFVCGVLQGREMGVPAVRFSTRASGTIRLTVPVGDDQCS